MRFPNDRAVVIDQRNPAMWIHRPELRRVQPAKLATSFDVPMLDPQFADQPQHFLDIERSTPSPDY
jgi:hypothetical protein